MALSSEKKRYSLLGELTATPNQDRRRSMCQSLLSKEDQIFIRTFHNVAQGLPMWHNASLVPPYHENYIPKQIEALPAPLTQLFNADNFKLEWAVFL